MIKILKQNLIAVAIITVLVIGIFSITFYLTSKIEEIKRNSKELVLYNQQMGELFLILQERITSQNLINQSKDIFMVYSMNIITKHYIQNKSPRYSPMSSSDIIIFLDEIYLNSIVSGINPFIPLAFACVETDFYNDALGLDGERSVFQIMETTARETYRKLNLPYLDNWWRDPKECVRLWFAYYHELSNNFIHEDNEKTIRWTALAYNIGLYRNKMIYNFSIETNIDHFVNDLYYSKGNRNYNKQIYEVFLDYSSNFDKREYTF
jgi:hypothetical protein